MRPKVGLGDNSILVGTDVFDKRVGDMVVLSVKVGLEVTSLVGELDCDNDSVVLYDELSIVGRLVTLLKLSVGLGDNSILVGADVFCTMVGDIVVLKVNVGLEVTKLVGVLDCDDNTDELKDVPSVGSSVVLLKLKVGLGDDSIPVGTDVFVNMVGDIVVLSAKVKLEVTRFVGELDCDDDSVVL